MNKSGMAIHSDTSFDEAEAVRFLSDVLEKGHRIKTFFKENDKTPNYDGSFELVDNNGGPIKKFNVQIKKCSGVKSNVHSNGLKTYYYDMDTSFLYYVKNKVTEGPAIYFIVDIKNREIFYKYLSDEFLIELSFENKQHVRCLLTDDDRITDTYSFYKAMLKIATERNELFSLCDKDELRYLQEAIDYVNNIMNNDLKTIKEHMFPDLWRFSLCISNNPEMHIAIESGCRQKNIQGENTQVFGLYPQFIGDKSHDIIRFKNDSFYQLYDFTGTQNAKEYCKEVIGRIVKSFCSRIPYDLLPDAVLTELVYEKAMYIHNMLYRERGEIGLLEAISDINVLCHYVKHIINNTCLTENEAKFYSFLMNNLKNGIPVLVFNPFMFSNVKKEILSFAEKDQRKHDNDFTDLGIYDDVFRNYIEVIMEMRKRKMILITPVWNHKPMGFRNQKGFSINTVKEICKDWFARLIELYDIIYKKVFGKNLTYKFLGVINYCFDKKAVNDFESFINATYIRHIIDDNRLLITYDDSLGVYENSPKDNYKIGKGDLFGPFLRDFNGNLLYNGLRCFIYQGLCEGLGLKCDGIHFDNRQVKLFG